MATEKRPMEAFVFVKAAPGKHLDVISRLAEAAPNKKSYAIKGIKEVFRTSGEYDAVAVITADDMDGINKIADVVKTLTSRGSEQIVAETNIMARWIKPMGDP